MPTGGNDGQLAMMKAATYWVWDDADKGYYVFRPGVGTDGEAGQMNTTGKTNDKTKGLLFFPAAGYGNSTFIYNVGTSGNYSSGTRISAYTKVKGVFFVFYCINTYL